MGRQNYFSDALSCLKLNIFQQLAMEKGKTFDTDCTEMPDEIWPLEKVWLP